MYTNFDEAMKAWNTGSRVRCVGWRPDRWLGQSDDAVIVPEVERAATWEIEDTPKAEPAEEPPAT